MIFKKTILKKILTSGVLVEFQLVKDQGEYKAALFVNGSHVPGPTLPRPLDQPKGELTHWMGNKPSVGLTGNEAEQVNKAVEMENDSLRYREEQREN